jgi:NADPH-dependent 2,4-dienoyl-CoA reductase/sulfur reductase-like enzyme
MFARPPDDARPVVALTFDGERVDARAGDSVAAALIASGHAANRITPVAGRPRGPWCLMGACHDCLVTVDGIPNVQGCTVAVADGMRVTTQRGARAIDIERTDEAFAIEERRPPGRPKGAAPPRGEASAARIGGMSTSTVQALDAARDDASIVDVAVVGAGPAGLAAATVAAECGLDVVLFDEQAGPGGQIHRGITRSPLARQDVLGAEYWAGGALVRAFERSGARYVPGTSVWALTRNDDATLSLATSYASSKAAVASIVTARAVIVATGALERPVPVPGWTLPGVMTVGAAQILLKTSGIASSSGTLIAGSGPLVWLYAWQCLNAGGTVDAILETTPKARLAQALKHLPAFVASRYVAKGLALMREVRARVRVVEHVERVEALGASRVEGVRFAVDGRDETLACDTLLLHQGVIPHLNFALAAGCDVAWNGAQLCFEPVVDAWGGSTLPGVWIAGDGAGIAGADAAPPRGALAALAAANALGRFDANERDRKSRPHRHALARALRGRAFLDALYRPADAFRLPDGDTLVCRCEEVAAARVEEAARSGAVGPNQVKALTRCGMGPCQGRYCAPTVTGLVARSCGVTPAEVGTYRQRFPIRPVTLAEIASLPGSEAADEAVMRLGERR